ncbi:MAG: serine protease [Bacillaceae bacterium]|nr:serine protease [Bacillaceae bacterium]
MTDRKEFPETIDEKDLYEDIDEEEIYEIIQEERRKAFRQSDEKKKPKRPFPKWAFWLIAFFMFVSALSALPKFLNLAAIEFVATSAKLSADEDIQEYKQSVVVVRSDDSKGTGFSISENGYILTNYHVIEDGLIIWVNYPDHGQFSAEVVASYPEMDLALLKIDGENLPYLSLGDDRNAAQGDHIYFIGNPLAFTGIANEGEVLGYTNSTLKEEVLMLKAPIYRGNSGSPVIAENGEVIGVVYATRRDAEHGKVGLAVPISYFLQTEEAAVLNVE